MCPTIPCSTQAHPSGERAISDASRPGFYSNAPNSICSQTMDARPPRRPPNNTVWDVKQQQYVPVLLQGQRTLAFPPALPKEVAAAEKEND